MRETEAGPPSTPAMAAVNCLGWRATASLALAVLGLAAPPPVRAGCDYGPILYTPEAHSRTLALSVRLPSMPSPWLPSDHLPQPCTGPNCSQRAPLPLSSPPVPAPIDPSQWAAHVLPSAWFCPSVDCLEPTLSIGSPIRRARKVFHPPRRVLSAVGTISRILCSEDISSCLEDALRSR
jgi:hypothetical protein